MSTAAGRLKHIEARVRNDFRAPNYYSNQTEYFGSVVRRLDKNSTRYHRRGAQLVEAYEQEQRATDELMRIYWAIGAKQQEMEITLARERELRSQADQIDSY